MLARLQPDRLRSLNMEILSHFKTESPEVRLFIVNVVYMLPQYFLFLSPEIVRDIVSAATFKANEGDIPGFILCISVAVALLALNGLQNPTQTGYDPLVKSVLSLCLKYELFVYQMFHDRRSRNCCHSFTSLLISLFSASLLMTVFASVLEDLNKTPRSPVCKVLLFHIFSLSMKSVSQVTSTIPEEMELFRMGFVELLSMLQDDPAFCVAFEFVSGWC